MYAHWQDHAQNAYVFVGHLREIIDMIMDSGSLQNFSNIAN